jgi:alkylation response protein AidB-like acyl-CoA dehydrogenase
LATLQFHQVRINQTQRIGAAGEGFKLAMATLDVFRTSVAAASLGFARRALDESVAWACSRKMFGQSLADFQITQTKIADMATLLDAATLLTYRAAWLRDQGQRITCEAAMAKMTATENAQKIIDMAVQLHGGMGVKKGCIVESLYREIRALRIYEGATEVQQLIIGRDILRSA